MTAASSRPLLSAPSLRELAARQAEVVTRRQLAEAGLSRDEVRAQIVARRWQAICRDVVVLHNAALTSEQRLWVAVLALDQPVALAGCTAAAAAGLRGFECEDVHIVVSRSCTADLPRWVRVHNSGASIRRTSHGPVRRPAYASRGR